jgi:hypothetical protein
MPKPPSGQHAVRFGVEPAARQLIPSDAAAAALLTRVKGGKRAAAFDIAVDGGSRQRQSSCVVGSNGAQSPTTSSLFFTHYRLGLLGGHNDSDGQDTCGGTATLRQHVACLQPHRGSATSAFSYALGGATSLTWIGGQEQRGRSLPGSVISGLPGRRRGPV